MPYECHKHGTQVGDRCELCTVLCFMPAPDPPREVMDIAQAANYLGISTDTLYRYAANGKVPAFRLGNRWRFKRSLLDQWMIQLSSKSKD